MGFFSADEIVANNTTESTVIAGALVMMVAVLIILVIAKMYLKYISGRVQKTTRREIQLHSMRQV